MRPAEPTLGPHPADAITAFRGALEQQRPRLQAELLELSTVARALGYTGSPETLDSAVSPRGFRLLAKVPRLPGAIIDRLVPSVDFGADLRGPVQGEVHEPELGARLAGVAAVGCAAAIFFGIADFENARRHARADRPVKSVVIGGPGENFNLFPITRSATVISGRDRIPTGPAAGRNRGMVSSPASRRAMENASP